ncbi:MAG: hypothetical protein IJ573_06695 [Clostridia bacterium]|nr:hypothetical protein [Clostridia bacterium]
MLVFKGAPKGYAGEPHHVGLVAEKNGKTTVIHASSRQGIVTEDELRAKDGWTLLAIHRMIRAQRKGAE